jgi:hypothetical protein
MFLDCCRVKQVAAIGLPSSLDCPMAIGGGRKTMVAYASEFLKSAFEARSASGITGGGGDDEDAGSLGREDEKVRGHFIAAPLAGLWAGAVRPQGGATARTLKR